MSLCRVPFEPRHPSRVKDGTPLQNPGAVLASGNAIKVTTLLLTNIGMTFLYKNKLTMLRSIISNISGYF